ncbi:hypothetical protein Tco_1314149 [Tanacetum coccineum]
MILPADHVLRAVINARLSATLFPPGVIYFYAVPLLAVLKYFRIHISQLSPFGAARISHFEVLTRVLYLGPSVAVFRAFYTRIYSDGLFSFAKRSLSAPSCPSKPPDSIKNWADHFFWVDSRVFPISVPLYTGGVLEKDPAPHLTARQEQAVQVLSSNKAPFRRYPECFLALVGLSPYYPFDENTYPVFERHDRTGHRFAGLFRTDAPPERCTSGEVRMGKSSGSGSGAGPEVSAPSAEENVVAEENVIPVGTYLDLVDPEGDLTVVVGRSSYHCLRTGGKTLASLRRTIPEGSLLLGPSSPADVHTRVTVRSSRVADAPVYTAADTVTAALNSEDAKRWYIPRWNITNDSLLDDGFSCRTSHTEHELELKKKLRAKYDARGVLLREKDAEIARLKSLMKSAVSQKESDISLLDSRATYLKSALDDSQAACDEARNLISSLSSERDGLASEVSTLHSAFRDFKEKMEAQQEAQARVVHRVAELEAHSPEYQGILGHALGRAVDYGMQEGLAAGHEHGVAGTPLSAVMAYNPEAAEAHYLDAVSMKSWHCFSWSVLGRPPEAAHLHPCLSCLSVISVMLSLRLLSGQRREFLSLSTQRSHRPEGARRKHAPLRQLMVDIVSLPLSSQNLLGEASTSVVAPCVEDLDTDEDLGSVVRSATRIASLLRLDKALEHVARLELVQRSISAVRSVGMPISAGMTASVPYVSENGVSPLLDLIIRTIRLAGASWKRSFRRIHVLTPIFEWIITELFSIV